MKLERQVMRSGILAILVAGAWSTGCGAESPDVPGDDEGGGTAGASGNATGGISGNATGGTPTGGVSGAFPTGGTPTGGTPSGGVSGAFPTGGTPTGGASGSTATGGASGSSCGITAAGDALITNLEDGTNAIAMPRIGYWYTYNDMTAGCAQMPAPDPSGATPFVPTAVATGGGNGMFGARTTGGACTTWGAGMGFDLANCMAMSGVYDASAFHGLSFYYKSTTALRVIIATTDVIPTSRAPGICVPGTAMGTECDNGHGADLPANAAGGMTMVSFATLNQVFGQMKMFNPAHVVNIQWQVANGMAFDFTIDDVSFTP